MWLTHLPPNPWGQSPRVPIFVIRRSRWRRFTGATIPVRKSCATRVETRTERDCERLGRRQAARCLCVFRSTLQKLHNMWGALCTPPAGYHRARSAPTTPTDSHITSRMYFGQTLIDSFFPRVRPFLLRSFHPHRAGNFLSVTYHDIGIAAGNAVPA